jgi:benzoylformate decarboxylase/acetolactate synthase-1/2/3 large subunit
LTLEQRARALAKVHDQTVQDARSAASYAWDASPVSTARVSAEVWEVIRHRDWALVGGQSSRLWNVDQPYQTMGLSPNGPGFGGAGGIGFMAPAAVGGALAHRKHGRFCVSLQSDGDLMYSPGVLWTAAHHRIPLMIVMLNNRAYHSEVMHLQRMANRNQRGVANAGVGTLLSDPNIDYAAMARSLGIYGVGPIADPTGLGPALRKAAEVVAGGEPALIDVVTQPR